MIKNHFVKEVMMMGEKKPFRKRSDDGGEKKPFLKNLARIKDSEKRKVTATEIKKVI